MNWKERINKREEYERKFQKIMESIFMVLGVISFLIIIGLILRWLIPCTRQNHCDNSYNYDIVDQQY